MPTFYEVCKYGNVIQFMNTMNTCNIKPMIMDNGFRVACKKGNIPILDIIRKKYTNKLIYARGENLNLNFVNKGLYYASQAGNINCVNYMISHGATNLNDPITVACIYGHIEIVKILAEHGAVISFMPPRMKHSGIIINLLLEKDAILPTTIKEIEIIKTKRVKNLLMFSKLNENLVHMVSNKYKKENQYIFRNNIMGISM